MKLSNSYFYTLRENVKEEDSTSGNLLVRAGMIKKSSSGIYMIMPMGKRAGRNGCCRSAGTVDAGYDPRRNL